MEDYDAKTKTYIYFKLLQPIKHSIYPLRINKQKKVRAFPWATFRKNLICFTLHKNKFTDKDNWCVNYLSSMKIHFGLGKEAQIIAFIHKCLRHSHSVGVIQ